jgi:hypothetical protein
LVWFIGSLVSDCVALVQTVRERRMTDFPSWKAVETLYQIEELDRTEGLEIRIVHAMHTKMP